MGSTDSTRKTGGANRPALPAELKAAGVTEREAQVLELLAKRLTNAEIAERLVVSVRTVESHVSSLLAKLGVSTRLGLAQLARAHPAGRAEVPLALSVLTKRGAFFGRNDQLDRLLHVYREASDEQRRGLVVVTGEPGSGKSRLVAELAIRIGANVRFGRCDRNRAAPYEPFLQSFGELRGVLLDPAATDADRYGLFETADQIFCDQQPLLLVVDDLQWADEATLLLLRHLARHADRSTLLIAATLRDERDLSQRVRSFLVDMSREQALEQLHVPRLDQAAALSLVRSRMTGTVDPAIQDAIVERAGGNPFFLHELADHATQKGAAHTIPFSVLETVRYRLAQLSDWPTRVLRLAAVAGQAFSVEILLKVLEAPETSIVVALGEAADLHFLIDLGSGRYEFAHAIVRDTVYTSISPSHRAILHKQIASALGQLDGDEQLGARAHHLWAAGTPSFEVALGAAEQASRRLAHEQAAEYYSMARETLADPGSTRGCELLLLEGRSLTRAGASAPARDRFERAAHLAGDLGSAGLSAQAALGVAGCGSLWSVDPPLENMLSESLEAVGDTDIELKARLLAALSQACYYTAPIEERERLSRTAVELARSAVDKQVLGTVLGARHLALWGPDGLQERLSAADEMVELAKATDNPELQVVGQGFKLVDHLEAADLPAAEQAMAAHARLAEQLRQPVHLRDAHVWRAMRAMMQGRLQEASEAAELARTVGRRAGDGDAESIYLVQRVWLVLETGDRAGLEEISTMARREAQAKPEVPAWRTGLSLALVRRGDLEAARTEFNRVAASGFDAIPRDQVWLNCLGALSEVCFVLKDASRARELRRLLSPYESRLVVVDRALNVWGSVSQCLGLLAATTGDLKTAKDHLQMALQEHRTLAADALIARTHVYLASILSEQDPQEAARHASTALHLPVVEDMPNLAAAAQAVLAKTGYDDGA